MKLIEEDMEWVVLRSRLQEWDQYKRPVKYHTWAQVWRDFSDYVYRPMWVQIRDQVYFQLTIIP
jgi:hypothetical protein